MILSPLILDLHSLGIGTSSSPRAEGLHASTIYNDLFQDLEPTRYKRDHLPPPLLLETGLVFEQILEEGLRRRFETGQVGAEFIERPGEFSHDDTFDGHPYTIHYNPDLFIYNGCLRVGEIKATWLSSHIEHEWLADEAAQRKYEDEIRQAILGNPKLDKYWCQLKFYCWFLKTQYGRLYPLFIAGNYTRPFTTQLIALDVKFSEDDLHQNYMMLMHHALHKGFIGPKRSAL